MEGTPYEETFETYNYSLPGAKYGFEGVDGLKTGSGPSSAFNYIATAKQGDTRLIEVILGVGDWSDQDGEYYRHPFGNALLKKVFDEYEHRLLLPKGIHEIEGKPIQLANDFYGVVKKGEEPEMTLQENRVSLASQKEQLTEDMPKLSLNYKKVETEEKRLPATRKVSIVEQAKAYIFPSLLLILGVALLLFPVKKKTLGRTRSSSRRKGVVVFRIAGIVCVLASLFMMIWEIL